MNYVMRESRRQFLRASAAVAVGAASGIKPEVVNPAEEKHIDAPATTSPDRRAGTHKGVRRPAIPKKASSSRSSVWLTIASLPELIRNEQRIVRKINVTPKGGQLFLMHPFQLLEDLGIRISDAVRKELIAKIPALQALSLTPYHALKTSKHEQRLKVRLSGLFEGIRQ